MPIITYYIPLNLLHVMTSQFSLQFAECSKFKATSEVYSRILHPWTSMKENALLFLGNNPTPVVIVTGRFASEV